MATVSIATWCSLRPIVLVDLLGIGHLTNSLGSLVLFQGIAFYVGAPIAGQYTPLLAHVRVTITHDLYINGLLIHVL